MLIYQVLAIIASIALIVEMALAIRFAPKEIRKAYLLPTILQLFSIFILIEQAKLIPYIIPHEIITGFSYFFSLYLTYTAVIAITGVGKKHRILFSVLWSTAAVIFWITSFFA
ncbi:MAG: hypothetical protein M0P13_00460 [Fibrobacteraceae bacterium]|nr:hypothetical protein [Fibrobacteraceae bacterium]